MKELIIFFVGLAYEIWKAHESDLEAKEIAAQAADRTRVEVERRLAKDRFDKKRGVVK